MLFASLRTGIVGILSHSCGWKIWSGWRERFQRQLWRCRLGKGTDPWNTIKLTVKFDRKVAFSLWWTKGDIRQLRNSVEIELPLTTIVYIVIFCPWDACGGLRINKLSENEGKCFQAGRKILNHGCQVSSCILMVRREKGGSKMKYMNGERGERPLWAKKARASRGARVNSSLWLWKVRAIPLKRFLWAGICPYSLGLFHKNAL